MQQAQPTTYLEQSQKKSFQFLPTTHSKHLYCKQCLQLMLQPIRLHRCGHTFCSSCIEAKNIKQCPICLQRIETKQKDILAGRLVGELNVRCMSVGCPWKGSLDEFMNFHKNGCKLREGGMEAWLKQLRDTINQNSIPDGGKLQQNEIDQSKTKDTISVSKQQGQNIKQSQKDEFKGQQGRQSEIISNNRYQKRQSNQKENRYANQQKDINSIQNMLLEKRIKNIEQFQ